MPFKKGNPGGPGDPWAKYVSRARKVIFKTIKAKDVKAIVLKLLELAKGGDKQAAELLLRYCPGKPKETVELTGQVPIKLYDSTTPTDSV